MKITLGRMILITTLICIFFGICNALRIEWSYLFIPLIEEYTWLIGGKINPPPQLNTPGEAIPLVIGAFIMVGLNIIVVIFIPLAVIVYLWELTKYKGEANERKR